MKKRRNTTSGPNRIRGTYHLTQANVEVESIRSLILRRRLQILIHSHIYYDLNQNLVSDQVWSGWAQELVELQKRFPEISRRVDYHQEFEGFEGSTGFDLPYRNPEIMAKAQWLLKNVKEEENGNKLGYRNHRTDSGADVIRIAIP